MERNADSLQKQRQTLARPVTREEGTQFYKGKEVNSATDWNEPKSRFFSESPDESPATQHLDFSLLKLRASDLQNCEIINKGCFKSPYMC